MPIDEREKRSEGSVHMDAIRGMAAIVVMLGHSRDLFFESLNGQSVETAQISSELVAPLRTARPQINLGNEAVMIFFVLSGYLVGGSVLRAFQRDSWSWTEYFAKRLTRLWVVLLPALLLTVVLGHLGLHLFPAATSIYHGPAGQSAVVPHLLSTLKLPIIAGNALFLQTILVSTPGNNIALWSLSNEFWYYVIFPLVVLASWRWSKPRVRIFSALLAVALLIFIGHDEAILFPTWLLGAVISLLPLRLAQRTSQWLMAGLSILLLPVMVAIRRLPLDIYLAQTCIAVYFGFLLYALLNRRQRARAGLYTRVATVLSDLSYPLYLVHLPILVLLCAFFNQPWHHWSRTAAHVATMLALDVVTIGAAYLFHLCFQKHTETVRLALLGWQRQHLAVQGWRSAALMRRGSGFSSLDRR